MRIKKAHLTVLGLSIFFVSLLFFPYQYLKILIKIVCTSELPVTKSECVGNLLGYSLYLTSSKDVAKYPQKLVDDNIIFECHSAAHIFGQKLQSKLGDLKSSLLICDNSCNYGCSHGAVVSSHKDQVITDLFTSICPDSQYYNLPKNECIHSLGHSNYAASHDLKKALRLCQSYEDENRAECVDGVVMEYVHHTLPTDDKYIKNVLSEICSVDNIDEMHCAGTVGAFIVYLYTGPANEKGREYCDFLPKNALAEQCRKAVDETIQVLKGSDTTDSLHCVDGMCF